AEAIKRLKGSPVPAWMFLDPQGNIVLMGRGSQTKVDAFMTYDLYVNGGAYKRKKFEEFVSRRGLRVDRPKSSLKFRVSSLKFKIFRSRVSGTGLDCLVPRSQSLYSSYRLRQPNTNLRSVTPGRSTVKHFAREFPKFGLMVLAGAAATIFS